MFISFTEFTCFSLEISLSRFECSGIGSSGGGRRVTFRVSRFAGQRPTRDDFKFRVPREWGRDFNRSKYSESFQDFVLEVFCPYRKIRHVMPYLLRFSSLPKRPAMPALLFRVCCQPAKTSVRNLRYPSLKTSAKKRFNMTKRRIL